MDTRMHIQKGTHAVTSRDNIINLGTGQGLCRVTQRKLIHRAAQLVEPESTRARPDACAGFSWAKCPPHRIP